MKGLMGLKGAMSIEIARSSEKTPIAVEGYIVSFVEGVRRGKDIKAVDPGFGDVSQRFLKVRVEHAGHNPSGLSENPLHIGLAGRLQLSEGREPFRHPGNATVFELEGKRPDNKDACATDRDDGHRPRKPARPPGREQPNAGDDHESQQEQTNADKGGGEKRIPAREKREQREKRR